MIVGDRSAAALLPGGPQANWTTLDGLLQKTAARVGSRLALVDDPDRPLWNRSPAKRLTYAEAEARVAAMAARFKADGLSADQVLALETPATVDTVLALLAAFRAGLIVAPLPPLWRRRDSAINLEKVRPSALVTTGMVDGDKVGTRGISVAGGLPTVSRVYGLGSGLPEGIVDLDTVTAPADATAAPSPGSSPDHVATLSMTAVGSDGAAQVHARSHAQWLAAGLSMVVECRLPEGASLLVPFSFSGLAGIGAGLVPWLFTGGTLHLHHFSGLRPLVVHAGNLAPDFVLLPGALAEPLVSALTRRGAPRPSIIGAVWKSVHPESLPPPVPSAAATKFVDVTVLDELAFIPRRRAERAPAGLPLGKVGLNSQSTNAGTMLETRLDGRPQRAGDRDRSLLNGTMALKGAVVPPTGSLPIGEGVATGLDADSEGFIRTDVVCRLTGSSPALAVPVGRDSDRVTVGGISVPTASLDAIYQGQPGVREAAAFLAPGTGNRQSLRAAVVFTDAAATNTGAFRRSLIDAGIALHLMPEGISIVPRLPRGADGAIDRAALAQSVTGPGQVATDRAAASA
ncbi:MAG: class I adenylate-forming enzyme family protein [Bauldia sp.]